MIFKKANYIQAISTYLAGFAKRNGAKCPVEIVPNGVTLDKFKGQNSKVKNTSQNSKVIITTSRLVYKNGIDILIRAVGELKSKLQTTNHKLLILGSGPEEINLKKMAQNLGLSNQVVFLGHINPDEIPNYLIKADIFVRPSRSEGLGNSFLEAMAAGLPIIGTPVGGIPDFLKNGETGLFCNVEDPNDLAEKISYLFTEAILYKNISENGKRLVRARYSWDSIALRMNHVFTKLCAF